RRAQNEHPIAAVQVQWSMWHPIDPDLLARCGETGVGIVAWAPMGRGFLTGTLTDVGEHDYRRTVERLTGANLAANNERFAPMRSPGSTPRWPSSSRWVTSADDVDREGHREPERRRDARTGTTLEVVLLEVERLRHHRLGEHGEDRARREREHERDRLVGRA